MLSFLLTALFTVAALICAVMLADCAVRFCNAWRVVQRDIALYDRMDAMTSHPPIAATNVVSIHSARRPVGTAGIAAAANRSSQPDRLRAAA